MATKHHSDQARRRMRIAGAASTAVGLSAYVLAPILIMGYMGEVGQPPTRAHEWLLVASMTLALLSLFSGLLMLYVGYRQRTEEVTTPCKSCDRWLPGDARFCSGCGGAV